MKYKLILAAGLATAIALPALAADMGSGGSLTGTDGMQGSMKTVPGAVSNKPSTGPNGAAVPEVPNQGPGAGADTTGSISGTSMSAAQGMLAAKGYSNIASRPGDDTAAAAKIATFTALNPQGKKVNVTVNTKTNTVVSETAAE